MPGRSRKDRSFGTTVMVNSDAITKTTAAKVSANEMAFSLAKPPQRLKSPRPECASGSGPGAGWIRRPSSPATIRGSVNWACIASHESKEWKQSQACGTNDAGAWIGGCFVRGLATLKLCSAEFAFSRSGDPRLFDKRGRGRCRIQMRRSCGFA